MVRYFFTVEQHKPDFMIMPQSHDFADLPSGETAIRDIEDHILKFLRDEGHTMLTAVRIYDYKVIA